MYMYRKPVNDNLYSYWGVNLSAVDGMASKPLLALQKDTEERSSSHLLRGGSLKSWVVAEAVFILSEYITV